MTGSWTIYRWGWQFSGSQALDEAYVPSVGAFGAAWDDAMGTELPGGRGAPATFYNDPYPTYAALHQHAPVKRVPDRAMGQRAPKLTRCPAGGYFLSRYADYLAHDQWAVIWATAGPTVTRRLRRLCRTVATLPRRAITTTESVITL